MHVYVYFLSSSRYCIVICVVLLNNVKLTNFLSGCMKILVKFKFTVIYYVIVVQGSCGVHHQC